MVFVLIAFVTWMFWQYGAEAVLAGPFAKAKYDPTKPYPKCGIPPGCTNEQLAQLMATDLDTLREHFGAYNVAVLPHEHFVQLNREYLASPSGQAWKAKEYAKYGMNPDGSPK